jgi:hypothetical protein
MLLRYVTITNIVNCQGDRFYTLIMHKYRACFHTFTTIRKKADTNKDTDYINSIEPTMQTEFTDIPSQFYIIYR